MLEVKNLKKVYKTKKGADVFALDGVSLRFAEKGMVFLLGKSGSGKSTLLNVCGGLDNPTEGEIIVKGRSSKDFSQSDFDSYRNTFIGFIFQEYNILNEFSVEDNIALALELQGKSKDKAAIAALLDEVDLAGYAKRKPNTLSGGQKQRIAIARALIKSPEIIMADEPTGALDSNTGKQVFDTLKKLSKDKLVIVVSHDRDFAEQYGDRIIELKDGKVISDVSKTQLQQKTLSENINAVGDVLCIKSAAELCEADFDKIKSFLKNCESDVVIATNKTDIASFKKVARINDEGEKEVFAETDASKTPKKEYTKEDSRFIRSKLPIRHAFKIGVSGLRSKPVRLFFTILLCSVAFILFGLLSTLNFYNSEATFKQTLLDTESPVLQLKKEYTGKITWYRYGEEDYSFDTVYDTFFTPDDLEKYKGELNSDIFGAASVYSNFTVRQQDAPYWVNTISAFAYLPEGHTLRGKINGKYPSNKNEIVVSSYAAEMFLNCGVYGHDGASLELSSAEDIIGKAIQVNGNKFTVTGIIDSGAIPEEFSVLKESGVENYNLSNKFATHLGSGLHLIVFSTNDRIEEVASQYSHKEGIENYTYISAATKVHGEYSFPDYTNSRYSAVKNIGDMKIYNLSGSGADLSDKEVILPMSLLSEIVSSAYQTLFEEANSSENYKKAEDYQNIVNLCYELRDGGFYKYDDKSDEPEYIPFTDAEYEKRINTLLSALKKDKISIPFALKLFDANNNALIGEAEEFSVKGFYKPDRNDGQATTFVSAATFDRLWNAQKISVSDYSVLETDYVESPSAIYSTLFLPGAVDTDRAETYWNVYSNEKFDENMTRVNIAGGFVNSLKTVDYLVDTLSKVFLWVGIVLAVFAALLLSNFISVSISHKKREIGILRAVGARSSDVFKIFFSESFVIAVICVIISVIASIFLCNFLNIQLASELGASLFVFGPLSLLVLIAIAVVTVIVATFLPVYNAAKKKPVDSIRSL